MNYNQHYLPLFDFQERVEKKSIFIRFPFYNIFFKNFISTHEKCQSIQKVNNVYYLNWKLFSLKFYPEKKKFSIKFLSIFCCCGTGIKLYRCKNGFCISSQIPNFLHVKTINLLNFSNVIEDIFTYCEIQFMFFFY